MAHLRKILTILGYVLLTLIVALVTVLLVAYGQGYVYDFKAGKLIHNGLVMLQSSPSGAEVSLAGKDLNKKTDYRQLYAPGKYTFELNKPGYQPWKKTVEVVAGEASMAQYAILTPNSPKTTVLDEQTAILAQSMTKDNNHLAYVVGGDQAGVYVLDIGGSAKKVFVNPAPEKDKPVETLESVRWSADGSHLLVVSRTDSGRVYRVMSNGGADVLNLTDQYRFDFPGLVFSQNNWKKLYWLSGGDLRRLDLDAKTVSGVLVDKVTQINPLGDKLLYVRSDTTGYSLWSLDSNDKGQSVIPALTPSAAYSLAYVSWRNHDELAVVPTASRTGMLYSDAFGSTPSSMTIAQGVDRASFSPDGHLLTFYGGNLAVTYDLDQSDYLKKRVSYTLPGISGLHELTWFDNFHIVLNEGGRIVWAEFDGTNAHDLGAAYAEFPAYGSSDNRSVIGVFDHGVGRAQVTEMLLKP